MIKDNIKVKGHRGTFYVIGERIISGKKYYLLESEIYGEDAPAVCINEAGDLVLDDIYNGFDDVEEYLWAKFENRSLI